MALAPLGKNFRMGIRAKTVPPAHTIAKFRAGRKRAESVDAIRGFSYGRNALRGPVPRPPTPFRRRNAMVRTEISLFLKNAPGELGRLSTLLSQEGVNIDAIAIQDASAYVQTLFQARGKSLKRIASSASYNSMRKDSAAFALIRLLVDPADKAVALLEREDFLYDTAEVIAIRLKNRPGELAKVTSRFGEAGVNINYVYGSVSSPDEQCLFVFCPEDAALARKIFDED